MWTVYGDSVGGSQGLSGAGVLLSNLGFPSSPAGYSEYEVKATIAFDQSGGDVGVMTYLRVFGGNPFDNSGAYYSVYTTTSFATGSCSYWVYKRYNQTSLLAQGGGSCHNGSTIRSLIFNSGSGCEHPNLFRRRTCGVDR